MQSVTMSTKGRMTIPARIRKRYGLKSGVELIIEDKGSYIKMIPKATKLTKLCGTLKNLDMKVVRKQIEEMRKEDRY
jgi:AbrB family looped-hinge helix DNA binding protein